jgi:hypothetical protein
MKTNHFLAISALTTTLAAGLGAGIGCGGSGESSSGQGGATFSTGTSQGAGLATSTGSNTGSGLGGGIQFDAGLDDASLTPDSACATQSSTATLVKKPVDVIVLIDNSGSMTEEIVGVQKNINTSFAAILDGSGLDYRVILVSRHGKATPGQSICVEAPLSGIPAGGCALTPVPPAVFPAKPVNNAPKFFHYSTEIASTDSWCKIVSTFTTPDEFALAPMGWSKWLRPEAFKAFIEITDDHSLCGTYSDKNTVAGGVAAAALFDADLLKLAPDQFAGAMPGERNYRFYSIVAMGYNTPPTAPYEPTDPILTTKCPTAANSGTGHQALSVLTGGLRFPLCDTASYDVVFKAIAAGVIEGAKVSCDFPVPEAPPGQTIDLASVVVQYTKGGMGSPSDFTQVADAASCAPNGFYLTTGTIHLCPDTCNVVQADAKAGINVLFACAGGIN